MNIQLSPQLYFGNAASLAGVLVARSSIAALLVPVRTVVGFISTLPVEVIFLRNFTAFRLPFSLTFLRAEPSTVFVRFLRFEHFSALVTGYLNSFLQMRFLAPYTGARNTLHSFGKVFTITGKAAKMAFCLFCLIEKFFERFSAILALYKHRLVSRIFSKIGDGVFFGRTLAGTILTRPGLVIPKSFPAFWAVSNYSRGVALTFARTISLFHRWVIREFFFALRAVRCFHSLASNMNFLELYHEGVYYGR